ncbi:MAG: hypothetical protein AB7S26_11360 [Sandaracinaceae bacterium]
MTSREVTSRAAVAWLAVVGVACGSERGEGPAPSESSSEPAPPTEPEPASVEEAPMQPIDPDAPALPERPVVHIGAGEVRRQAWLDSEFPCRAISTLRYRTCRFEEEADGRVRIRFPESDVLCDDVRFDERGDPSELNACRGRWLTIPADNPLRPLEGGERTVWAGSLSGWRWRDRDRYCCPGMWIMEPRDGLPPLEPL